MAEFREEKREIALKVVVGDEQSLPVIKHYTVVEKLGTGSLTTVYKVRRDGIDEFFAAKVLRPEFSQNPRTAKRFVQEGQKAQALNDPHLVSVYEISRTGGGEPVLICDFVDGGSLADRLSTNAAIDEIELIDLAEQFCQGLVQAHKAGVTHRDIKPANIVFQNKQGASIAKLADFGIAKVLPGPGRETKYMTPEGESFGNPTYMSPEQLQGGKLDPRSDIYSLGCVFFECLAGRAPFRSKNPVRVALKHLTMEVPTFDSVDAGDKVSAGLAIVIMRMLRKAPEDRYQTVQELLDDLKIVRAGGAPRFVPLKTVLPTDDKRATKRKTKVDQTVDLPEEEKAKVEPSKVKLTRGENAKIDLAAVERSVEADVEHRPVAPVRNEAVRQSHEKVILIGLALFGVLIAAALPFTIFRNEAKPDYLRYLHAQEGRFSSANEGQSRPHTEYLYFRNESNKIVISCRPGDIKTAVLEAFNRNTNLEYLDMQDVDLEGIALPKADFHRANLSFCDFRGADLRGADFSQADLIGANFEGANLKDADFSEANLTQSVLLKANCLGASMRSAKLKNATVDAGSLDGADTRDAEYLPRFEK